MHTVESFTLHFYDSAALSDAWEVPEDFLGIRQLPPNDFNPRKLCLHAHPPRERDTNIKGFSPVRICVPTDSVRHCVITGPWEFRDVRHLIDWCCTINIEAISVHGALIMTDERTLPAYLLRHRRLRAPDSGWEGRLRSLELHQVPLDGLQRLYFPALKKLLVSDIKAISGHGLAAALTSAGETLETLSISVRFGTPYEVSVMYDSAFVFELLRRVALRRFSSIGPFYFTNLDWEVLCARAFPHMLFVHVEQPNNANPRFMPDQQYRPYRLGEDDLIVPTGMTSVCGGRAFISKGTGDVHRGDLAEPGNATTLCLLRWFLQSADPEGHFILSREMVVTHYQCVTDSVLAKRPFRMVDLLLPKRGSQETDASSCEANF
ncbi:hypothetical protein CLCR_10391 [Cladophialophora carrionii]|uniref:Uncharacterized protein n=1 Tax=Cladophialophora carrionii TaxID=86049 RepID=A0A1C1CW34_9EURO|nr:hypothetical protein CLCR_10391 [Cladophialophora carrionii]